MSCSLISLILNTRETPGTTISYSGAMFGRVSRDVYGFKLGYYNNDYIPIDVTNATAFANKIYTHPSTPENTGDSLFNGNISYTP